MTCHKMTAKKETVICKNKYHERLLNRLTHARLTLKTCLCVSTFLVIFKILYYFCFWITQSLNLLQLLDDSKYSTEYA